MKRETFDFFFFVDVFFDKLVPFSLAFFVSVFVFLKVFLGIGEFLSLLFEEVLVVGAVCRAVGVALEDGLDLFLQGIDFFVFGEKNLTKVVQFVLKIRI